MPVLRGLSLDFPSWALYQRKTDVLMRLLQGAQPRGENRFSGRPWPFMLGKCARWDTECTFISPFFFFQLAAQWLTGFHPPHMASSERHRLPSRLWHISPSAACRSSPSFTRHPTAKPVSRVIRLIFCDLALWYHAVPRLRIRFRSRLSLLYRTINTILRENISQSLSQSLIGCAVQWDLHLKILLPPACTLEQRNKGQ